MASLSGGSEPSLPEPGALPSAGQRGLGRDGGPRVFRKGRDLGLAPPAGGPRAHRCESRPPAAAGLSPPWGLPRLPTQGSPCPSSQPLSSAPFPVDSLPKM